MKKCSHCHLAKPLSEFNFKNKEKEKLSYQCKQCSRSYLKGHYWRNREYYLNKARKRNERIRKEIRSFLIKYLTNHSCIDCGEKDIVVLEFDHQHDKIEAISKMARHATMEKIKEEIQKCEVRCANCHRRKTFRERGILIDLPL